MTKEQFQKTTKKYADVIEQIKQSAHELHKSVNQTYDKIHPYGFHLDMVVDLIYKYGHWVCAEENDVLPLFFGGYYHDSIEDARMTYNTVMDTAGMFMNNKQALMAAELVFALTNDKGRTRAERAGEKYYKGIRETPYAPFVKLADRLANISYSFHHENEDNAHMKVVYSQELPHFLEAIKAESDDPRLVMPSDMVEELLGIVHG